MKRRETAELWADTAKLHLFDPESGESLRSRCSTARAVRRLGSATAVGETKAFALDGNRSPVNAVVEKDKDGDGYGDFNQDRCLVSAGFQTDCSLPAIAIGKVSVEKKAILVEASNNPTPRSRRSATCAGRSSRKAPL